MKSTQINGGWNADLYDDKHSFVFKYGEDLVDFLLPEDGERILDLGCGTGYLTNFIASSGANVVGIDKSLEMINKARASYPSLEFKVLPGEEFQFEEHFDAIFSNAALHWMLENEKVIDCMYRNLKPTGRIVLEMGGKNNVENIITALKESLIKNGFSANAATQVWYFPSEIEYTELLEKRGFKVTYSAHFSRETTLNDTRNGIKDWLKMFGSNFLNGIENKMVEIILNEVQDALRPILFKDNTWHADYKRLRLIAIK